MPRPLTAVRPTGELQYGKAYGQLRTDRGCHGTLSSATSEEAVSLMGTRSARGLAAQRGKRVSVYVTRRRRFFQATGRWLILQRGRRPGLEAPQHKEPVYKPQRRTLNVPNLPLADIALSLSPLAIVKRHWVVRGMPPISARISMVSPFITSRYAAIGIPSCGLSSNR